MDVGPIRSLERGLNTGNRNGNRRDDVMKAESRALGQALLDHHRMVTRTYPPGKHIIIPHYLIGYDKLCRAAGVPHLTRVVGNFLVEIAEWCQAQGYPALNSLAINEQKGMPGDGYDKAGGFLIINWPTEVESCIRFKGYPTVLP